MAAALLLFATAIQLTLQNHKYGKSFDQLNALRADVYAGVFPGVPTPAGAAFRLRSECIKLEGLTQQGPIERSDLTPDSLQAFDLLHDVTVAIPAELKLYVTEISLDDGGIRLAGQTTSHAAAGDLVRRLNAVPGIAVHPPRTKLRKDHTVDFRIRATREDAEHES
jgi:hypothetical protein